MSSNENCEKKKSHIVWTKNKELFLLKEMAAEGVLTHQLKSKERGSHWQTIAAKMNTLGDEVTSRSVRDHYNNMSKKYRTRMAREERATGDGGDELPEEEKLLENLIEIEDETERMGANEEEAKREKIENKKCQSLEMREGAMERFGQTRKRIGGGNVESEDQIRERRRASEMLEWLKGRTKLERKENEIGHSNKREELLLQRMQHTEVLQLIQQTQQQISMQMNLSEQYTQQQAIQHQQQQEQQQQQFHLMQQQVLAIMQQQTQMMANIFQNKK